jgi:phosphoenolpyruvate synthase/pyruvate phosphate dikinase
MIYAFDASPLPKLTEVGGKGFSLTRMTHADLPVPPGFTLAVAFFEKTFCPARPLSKRSVKN